MVLDDFYTMVMKNSDDNKGIRQPNLNKPGNPTPTFEFNTEAERDNFINYLKTDFARFCLSLLKNNGHLSSGEMELIPWLDFTEEWDDDKLFKKFNVSQDLQDYIRDFLPDFHGIRK
jgi:site-specific DNA-methyltransferase (adenine-specific)